MLKCVLINERESNIMLPKIFHDKNLMMKKSSRADLIKKGLTRYVKNICVCDR